MKDNKPKGDKVTVESVVEAAGMVSAPEFYSAMRARECDLSGSQLFQIYSAIKAQIGDKQAKAFRNMVESMPTLSAMDFLNELYSLESRDWGNVPKDGLEEKRSTKNILKNEGGSGEAYIFSALVSAHSGGGKKHPDETWKIKQGFYDAIEKDKKGCNEKRELDDNLK